MTIPLDRIRSMPAFSPYFSDAARAVSKRSVADRAGFLERLMHVGVAKVTLQLPENESLKGKRRVIASTLDRVKNKFNVSIAEVDANDSLRTATLGVTAVSNSARHAEQVVTSVVDFISTASGDAYVSDVDRESLSGF